jgi:hypothetical protein
VRLIALGVVVATALGLSGCASTSQEQVLGNLEHCERTYMGQIGGVLPPSVSVSIRCNAKPFEVPKVEPTPE